MKLLLAVALLLCGCDITDSTPPRPIQVTLNFYDRDRLVIVNDCTNVVLNTTHGTLEFVSSYNATNTPK